MKHLCYPLLLLVLLGLLVCGCSHLSTSRKQDKAEVKALQAKTEKPGSRTMTALQLDVMRFADDYAATVAQAADDFSSTCTNIPDRMVALRWKLEQATAAYVNAAGRNPVLNALDMVVLTTLSRMVMEAFAWPGSSKLAPSRLVETQRRLETEAWRLVEGVLKEEQKIELADIMREWRRKNPEQRYIGGIRLREFAETLGKTPGSTQSKPTSVFNLLFIDPMAGLDPTARAIEETRQSAERITYYAQRAPLLLSWQAELLTYQLAEQPAARQLLADAARLSKAAEGFTKTVEEFPNLLEEQREAAIRQLLEGIAVERTNLFSTLATQEVQVRDLVMETRETLKAGTEMAGSVNGAIHSLHEFVRFVSPGLASNTIPPMPETNKQSFDVLEYGKAASQVGAMALDLNSLLRSVNESLPHVNRLGQQAQANARQFVDHAFWRALLLVLIGLVAALIAGLTYRVLTTLATGHLRPETNRAKSELEV